jgi:DNA-binding transcriptional LysR family regulator
LLRSGFGSTPSRERITEHPAAQKERLVLQDLAKDEWILFPKRFDPVVFEAIMDAAQCGCIAPKNAHDVIAPQQAVDLVSEHLGVAILTQPSATGFHADGVVVKPLSDTSLCFNTYVILRADNTSRLIEEYVRMFLRKYAPQRLPPKRMELSLSAQVVSLKKVIGRSRR